MGKIYIHVVATKININLAATVNKMWYIKK